jgi:uncharacterized protein (UPF0264 family)
MTRFLASVRDAVEAEVALRAGADIIDLKDPSNGALGALDIAAIRASATSIAGRAPVSATIGDLPMHAETVRQAVLATAACNVDYVKLGLFPDGDARRCLDHLAAETRRVRLIIVLFADAFPDFDAVAEAARIGAKGVMLDTMGKNSGSLLDNFSYGALTRLVETARGEGLIVGLAGSLRAAHVPPLLRLNPDLLGFRGALCRGGTRNASLDPLACASIRALITRPTGAAPHAGLGHPASQALC